MAPKPTNRYGRRQPPDGGHRGIEPETARLGHRHRPAAGGVEAIHVERHVEAVDLPGDRPRPAIDRSLARLRGQHARRRSGRSRTPPALRDSSSSSTWPPNSAAWPSSTVGPSAAATRSGSPLPQIIANGIPKTLPDGVLSGVLKSPWASNQAMAKRAPGPSQAQAGQRAGVGGAVAAEDQETDALRRAAGGSQRGGHVIPLARQELADRRPVLRARVVIGAGTPGGSSRSPASRSSTPASPGRRAKPVGQPEGAEPRRRLLHAGQMAAEGGRHPDDDDRTIHEPHGAASWADAYRRLRPRALFRPLGIRRQPPAMCLGRPGLTRWPSCSRSPTTRRARCGTTSSSATPSRPGTRSCGARSPRSTTTIEPDEVLTFAGAEEAVFCLMNVLAGARRPRDRHLAGLPEPVRGRPCRRGRRHAPRAPRVGRLGDRPRPAAPPADARPRG